MMRRHQAKSDLEWRQPAETRPMWRKFPPALNIAEPTPRTPSPFWVSRGSHPQEGGSFVGRQPKGSVPCKHAMRVGHLETVLAVCVVQIVRFARALGQGPSRASNSDFDPVRIDAVCEKAGPDRQHTPQPKPHTVCNGARSTGDPANDDPRGLVRPELGRHLA